MNSLQKLSDQVQENVSKTAANVFLYYDGEEQRSIIEELKDIVFRNCFANAKLSQGSEVMDKIMQELNSDENNLNFEDIVKEYNKEMENINPDVLRDKNLVDFNRQIQELLKDAENANENELDGNEDDDLQFTQDTLNVIDPFTKQRMIDPMRNKICGHIYDRESVIGMLKVNSKTRCPVVGCGSKEYITMDNMESDIVLRTRLLKKTV